MLLTCVLLGPTVLHLGPADVMRREGWWREAKEGCYGGTNHTFLHLRSVELDLRNGARSALSPSLQNLALSLPLCTLQVQDLCVFWWYQICREPHSIRESTETGSVFCSYANHRLVELNFINSHWNRSLRWGTTLGQNLNFPVIFTGTQEYNLIYMKWLQASLVCGLW